ncbi:hypothetical protein C1H46_015451 [Malus baccata]|uniref:Uncharacterized protein n=1 Tax=Malus baccata TaxID=106549 RepID=A0A540MJ39_MALBA|nr:hypothetical protein C1H46_015451 [Malus baccata]
MKPKTVSPASTLLALTGWLVFTLFFVAATRDAKASTTAEGSPEASKTRLHLRCLLTTTGASLSLTKFEMSSKASTRQTTRRMTFSTISGIALISTRAVIMRTCTSSQRWTRRMSSSIDSRKHDHD